MENVDDLKWVHGEISEAWRAAIQQPAGRWRTKTGDVVELRDMTDDHLINTARLLLRFAQAQLLVDALDAYEATALFRGEMAQYACESAGDVALLAAATPQGTVDASRCRKLREVADELKRRGLALPTA